MLHDPQHQEPTLVSESIRLSDHDTAVLRRLAEEQARIADLPVHREKAGLWRKLNDRQSVRPMVLIYQIPWHEMDVDGELTLKTEHPWARDQEQGLRQLIYQWKHLPADMVVDDFICCSLAIRSTGFGISEDVDIVRTDEANGVVSRHFHKQIHDFQDLEKIRMPVVTHDQSATHRQYETMCQVYSDIMPVKKVGQKHIWFTPWDYLIRWWGVEDAMMDMYERPELVHATVDRMVDAWMTELDQFEALNVLSLDSDNASVGSGGYGYASDLPGKDFDPQNVKPHNMWGCSNAQIFAEVSPDFHWEFALKHDQRWLKRWGMTYYGCCEQLDGKLELLKRIPNLRKFSVSPRCRVEKTALEIGNRYVLSRKPNPAIFADDRWNPNQARKEIRDYLDQTRGCHSELILKDISTVRYDPKRLWEWAKIAREEVESAQ